MTDNRRIYLSPPHMSGHEQAYIAEAFATNWVSPMGPNLDAFEREFMAYTGATGAVALSSGTAAIHIALRLLGVGPGDCVFSSSLTFIGSTSPVVFQGAEPVLIDSEPGSWNMSPQALKRAFIDAQQSGRLPKAVIVVNLYGHSADLDPLIALCDSYGVPVVEDAAESLGATYKGKASGTLGRFGIYSFNGNKIITTSGGGMLVSNDLDALEKARFLSTQARDRARHYQHSQIGYNYRLSNILAGIGRGQLAVLEERVRARREIFMRYYEALSGIDGLAFMPEAPYGRHTRWLTTLTIDPAVCGAQAIDIMDRLEADNIESRPVWKPLHLQPVFKGCRYYPHNETDSVSDRLFENGICLPSGSSLTCDEQARVLRIMKSCLQRA